jgi:hypothetical protein
MTEAQRISLQARWWPAACKAQGWKVGDRELRLRVCAWAVSLKNPTQLELLEAINSDRTPSRYLASTNDLDNRADVDAVKDCLGMLADDLQRTREVGNPHFGSARRKRDLVRSHLKCLGMFEPKPKRFVAHLIQDMFGAKLGADVTIKELSDEGKYPSDLQRLLMRVAAVVNQKRNENVLVPPYTHLQGTIPLTIHEMKVSAGVDCDCAICKKLNRAPIVPPLVENWADFEPENDSELEGTTDEFGGMAEAVESDPF